MDMLTDVHHHAIPDFYADAMRKEGMEEIDGFPIPEWSVDRTLALMESAGIGFAILSVSAPGVSFLHGSRARGLAMQCNDFLSSLQRQYPDKLGFFATVPLDDSLEAVQEAERALDTLGAQGVCLLTNHRGSYPGDDRFWPLYGMLNAHKARVFLHPTRPVQERTIGLRPPILDYPIDTTYAVAHLLTAGVLEKFSGIEWILSHCGGAIPFLSKRLILGDANLGKDLAKAQRSAELMQQLRFDTALAFDPAILRLTASASKYDLSFGSDFPFISDEMILREAKTYTELTKNAQPAKTDGA
jgi:predicted TIM-barrel fold metal-dependent hydrolase